MNKRVYVCAAVILILSMFALVAYKKLEIYPKKTRTPPLRETLVNKYYAMEQWLNKTGHRVRIEKRCSPAKIAAIQEGTAIVFAAACNWEDTHKFIVPWVERGNSLVICMDYYDEDEINENLLDFLYDLGIYVEIISADADADDEDSEYLSCLNNPWGEAIPDFDSNIIFYVDEDDIFIMCDGRHVRLASVSLGEGSITVTGIPFFMYNDNLIREVNARLAWELTGERAGDKKGVLFVRTKQLTKSMFGKIMEKGNLVPAGISVFLVIVFGFWMVIPAFGLVHDEKQTNSRPIRERFTAEIGFLKKYRALDYYLETYERELHLSDGHQFTNDSKEKKKYNYSELMNKLRSIVPEKYKE